MPELRRSYHDRIAELRDRTIGVIRVAADATADFTLTLVDADRAAGQQTGLDLSEAARQIAQVEADVLDLLALQSPVARDLRVILASRDIARAGELCLGLCRTLATRKGGALDVVSSELRTIIAEMGVETASLLRQANGAWATLDEQQAVQVAASASASRQLQRTFLADLLELRSIPVNAAVDLGMIGRVYERLTDHAVEIASSVTFVVTGELPSQGTRVLKP